MYIGFCFLSMVYHERPPGPTGNLSGFPRPTSATAFSTCRLAVGWAALLVLEARTSDNQHFIAGDNQHLIDQDLSRNQPTRIAIRSTSWEVTISH